MKSPVGSFPKICMPRYIFICASYKVGSTIDLKMFCLKWIISEIHCLLSWVVFEIALKAILIKDVIRVNDLGL